MNKANWSTALTTLLPTLGLTYVGLLQLVNLEQQLTAIYTFTAAGAFLLAALGSLLAPRALPLVFLWLGHLVAGLAMSAQFIHDWSDPDATMAAYAVQAISQLPAGYFALQWWLSLDGRHLIKHIRLALSGTTLGLLLQAGFAFLDEPAKEQPLLAIGAALAALGLGLSALFLKGVEPMTLHVDVPKDKPQEPPTAD